jgi:hypothetical protein
MAGKKRYIPKEPFAVFVDGVPFVFSPDYVDPATGELGYTKLPKLSKAQKGNFRVAGGAEKIESATAAPGEER